MLAGLRDYLRELVAWSRWRLGAILLLSLLGSVTEGFGLLLLVPLLALLYPGITGGENPTATHLRALLEQSGLSVQLESVLLLFLLLLVVQSGVAYLRDQASVRLRVAFSEQFRLRLHRAILAMRWEAFSTVRPADFTHLLISEMNRIGQGTNAIMQLIVSGLMAMIYLAVALYLSPLFSLLAVTSGVLFGLAIRPLNRRAHNLGHRFGEGYRTLMQTIQEQLASHKLAKCFSARRRHQQTFEEQVEAVREQQLFMQHNSSLTRTVLRLGGGVVLTCCIYLGVKGLALSLPQLLVLIYTFARLLPLISGLQQSFQQLLHMLPAFTTVQARLREVEQAAEAIEGVPEEDQRLTREIRLSEVAFGYRSRPDRPVLEGVNLALAARQTLAIVGPSGAGKSTLADLILGLLTPSAGEITVDGAPMVPHRWRSRIAYVPQETFLFHDTIRANLLWAAPQASDSALWEALELAAAADFVRLLPEGLESVVGERGIQLSGGERQRIALARALLRHPDLLVLDEATSALDHESEERITEAIHRLRGDLTIVIIAHRLSTVRDADRVAVLSSGQIVEQGSWGALAENPESYLNRAGESGRGETARSRAGASEPVTG